MCWTNTLPHQWLLYVVNSYCLDEELLLLLFFTVFKSWIPKLSFSVKITWSILLFRCFLMASAIWFWMSIFEGQNLLLVIAGIWWPEKRASFINTSNKVFICGTLVILFSQTIFLIWSFHLWSMEWSKLADWKIQNALKAHDYRSHSPFIITRIMSLYWHDRRSHHPATWILSLFWHMTGEVIIQLPGYSFYTIMTGEVIIQLPGYCLYTDIWQENSSSSYPDVSILTYDRRSHNPTTLILSYDRRSHHPATRIMFLYCHMTEVIIQLPGCFYTDIWQEKS